MTDQIKFKVRRKEMEEMFEQFSERSKGNVRNNLWV